MTYVLQAAAIIVLFFGGLTGALVVATSIGGDEEANTCLVTSHSISEQAVEGSWVYDSRTLYEGDCVIAGHSS